MFKKRSFMAIIAVLLFSLSSTSYVEEKLPYKDKVFENFTVQSDIVYSEATDQINSTNWLLMFYNLRVIL